MARRGNGRQRIVMQRMLKESARQVTFSKRRSGLMKKASELCTLCAAEVLIVVFSPGGKVFSFCHPSTESIIQRFLGEEPEAGSDTREIVQAHRSSKQSNLNFHLNQLECLMDAEKRKGDGIDVMRRETEGRVWWEGPMERFNLEQMEKFMERVVMYRESVKKEIHLLQQEQKELNGKGPASVVPSSQEPLDPMMVGLNGSVTYDPMVAGSSSKALLDRRIRGFNGGISFDPMASGSSSQTPFDPMATSGSSNQTSLDPRTYMFYGGLTYDRMTAGASGAVPPNQLAMGCIGTVPYNPSPLRFQARATIKPKASGPSNGGFGVSFDEGASDYGKSCGHNNYYGCGFP